MSIGESMLWKKPMETKSKFSLADVTHCFWDMLWTTKMMTRKLKLWSKADAKLQYQLWSTVVEIVFWNSFAVSVPLCLAITEKTMNSKLYQNDLWQNVKAALRYVKLRRGWLVQQWPNVTVSTLSQWDAAEDHYKRTIRIKTSQKYFWA